MGKEVSTEVRVALVTFTFLPKVKAMGFPSASVHCMAMSEGKRTVVPSWAIAQLRVCPASMFRPVNSVDIAVLVPSMHKKAIGWRNKC